MSWSYEATHVGGLYHVDFHEGRRAVLTSKGTLERPVLFGCLDDRSRLACHLQWYGAESARTLVHGLEQAFLKRGIPRALMSDRGKAELAVEVTEGLERLGVVHRPTLPYSPYQNAKQGSFWGNVEGRLLAMLEGVDPLTLEVLNEATQAWVAPHDGATAPARTGVDDAPWERCVPRARSATDKAPFGSFGCRPPCLGTRARGFRTDPGPQRLPWARSSPIHAQAVKTL